MVPDLVASGTAIIDLGPDFRLREPGRLPALVRLRAPRARTSSTGAVYGLPELHRDELVGARRRAGRDRRLARLLSRPRRSSRWRRSPGRA